MLFTLLKVSHEKVQIGNIYAFFVQLAISAQSEKEVAVFRVKPPAQRRTEGRLFFGGKILSIKVSNLWNFQFI